ncbi:MAG: hypothetical protein CUN55_08400 [Phototrophicales bacterium]|nr:MAG: hypothetical protein CUN55_08400 [Phototrophicales bacterium]
METVHTSSKPPMSRDELRDVVDLALWAGQLLMNSGADSKRVEEVVHRIGTGLGCDWMDILVSSNTIIASTVSNGEFRTKVRRVVGFGVNMSVFAATNDLRYRVESGELDRFTLREELERLSNLSPQYSRWVVVITVGLSCAAFSRLFHGDWPVFFMTFLASSIAMFVRQEMKHRYFNDFLIVIVTAFVATLIAGLTAVLQLSDEPSIALASSVLLLVPGVPLINSAEDLLQGHFIMGIARSILGGIIALCIALGLSLAIQLLGINGL